MKNNNTVEACTHCHVCQNQCEFLKKYGIDIGDTEKLKELSYHCFLCGKCTEVCPENIDGREYILNLRREKVEKSGGTLEEKGYGMLLKEKKDYIYRNYRHAQGESILFPGCNFPSFYPVCRGGLCRQDTRLSPCTAPARPGARHSPRCAYKPASPHRRRRRGRGRPP